MGMLKFKHSYLVTIVFLVIFFFPALVFPIYTWTHGQGFSQHLYQQSRTVLDFVACDLMTAFEIKWCFRLQFINQQAWFIFKTHNFFYIICKQANGKTCSEVQR